MTITVTSTDFAALQREGDIMARSSRREKGTGNIYQRNNGTWVGRLTIGKKPDGSPLIKYFSGKTQSEVKRKIREYNQISAKIEPQKITVEEYIKNWMILYKKDSLKPNSYDRLENTVNYQVIPFIGDIQLQQLSSDDIQKMLSTLKSNGLAYSTIKKAYDAVNAVLKHAAVKEDILKNPMLLVKMPEKKLFQSKEIRFFTRDEAVAITEESMRLYSTGKPVYTYGDLYILMLNTGIRLGEAIGLEKQDWDRECKKLHIRRNIQIVKNRKGADSVGGYYLAVNTTKTSSGTRDIPLNKNATEALERLQARNPDSKYIAPTKNGEISMPANIQRGFKHLLENIGIERAGVHSLRHTFASFLFANQVDVKTVQKLLGHASIQITLNTYIHLIDKVDSKAVETLDNMI